MDDDADPGNVHITGGGLIKPPAKPVAAEPVKEDAQDDTLKPPPRPATPEPAKGKNGSESAESSGKNGSSEEATATTAGDAKAKEGNGSLPSVEETLKNLGKIDQEQSP